MIDEDFYGDIDLRIAVTTTGTVRMEDPLNFTPNNLGAFVSPNQENVECAGLESPIISTDQIDCPVNDRACQYQAIKQQFSCRANVGMDGVIFERGLKAIHSLLSCNGPNVELFGECYTLDVSGQR